MKIIKLSLSIIFIELLLISIVSCSSDNNIKVIMEEYAAMNPSDKYLMRFFRIGENNYVELCKIQKVEKLPYDGYIELDNKKFYYYCINKCIIPEWIKQHSHKYSDREVASDLTSEFYSNNNIIYKLEASVFEKVDRQDDIFVTTPKATSSNCIKSKTLNRLLNEYINSHFHFSYYLMFEKVKGNVFVYIGCNEFYDSNILDSYFKRDNHYVFIYYKNILSSDIGLFEENELLKDINKIEIKSAEEEIIPIFPILQKYKIVSKEKFIQMENPFVF